MREFPCGVLFRDIVICWIFLEKKEAGNLCPLEKVVNIIDGKWTVLILWHLRNGQLRFSELNQRIPNVSQKMLTQKLRHLEESQFLKRHVYATKPPHVEYELTEQGLSFLPILISINEWGWSYLFSEGRVI